MLNYGVNFICMIIISYDKKYNPCKQGNNLPGIFLASRLATSIEALPRFYDTILTWDIVLVPQTGIGKYYCTEKGG